MHEAQVLEKSHWAADRSVPVVESTVGGLLKTAALKNPDRIALVAGAVDPDRRETWTYARLEQEAEALAAGILRVADPGDHVAVWAPNGASWVALEFAAALAGTPLVTLNPAFRPAEAEYALQHSKASLLFHADSFRGEEISAVAQQLVLKVPTLRYAVRMSDLDRFSNGAGNERLPNVDASDPAFILFTSGTTGFPKAAMLRHLAVTNVARFCAQRAGFDGGTWLNPLPLFHVGGCVNAVLGPLWSSGTLVLLEAFQPGLVLELAKATHPDLMGSVPTMVLALMEDPTFDPSMLGSLKTILSGGSTVPVDLCRKIETVLECRFSIVYGQTETSSVISQVRPDDSELDKATTVGQALPQIECKIVDGASGEAVGIGEQGELWVRGYQTMIGYFENDGATNRTLDSDAWLHTGDLAVMDHRGYMQIVGRLKDLIIRGGENIWPFEIEEVVQGHPDVAEVAVVGVPDARWGEVVACVVRTTSGGERPAASELSKLCETMLAKHKIPVAWYRVDSFPMTASGKVQKFALQDSIGRDDLELLA